MARRPVPPPKPRSPILTAGQKRRRIERLQKCITNLEAFDHQKVLLGLIGFIPVKLPSSPTVRQSFLTVIFRAFRLAAAGRKSGRVRSGDLGCASCVAGVFGVLQPSGR